MYQHKYSKYKQKYVNLKKKLYGGVSEDKSCYNDFKQIIKGIQECMKVDIQQMIGSSKLITISDKDAFDKIDDDFKKKKTANFTGGFGEVYIHKTMVIKKMKYSFLKRNNHNFDMYKNRDMDEPNLKFSINDLYILYILSLLKIIPYFYKILFINDGTKYKPVGSNTPGYDTKPKPPIGNTGNNGTKAKPPVCNKLDDGTQNGCYDTNNSMFIIISEKYEMTLKTYLQNEYNYIIANDKMKHNFINYNYDSYLDIDKTIENYLTQLLLLGLYCSDIKTENMLINTHNKEIRLNDIDSQFCLQPNNSVCDKNEYIKYYKFLLLISTSHKDAILPLFIREYNEMFQLGIADDINEIYKLKKNKINALQYDSKVSIQSLGNSKFESLLDINNKTVVPTEQEKKIFDYLNKILYISKEKERVDAPLDGGAIYNISNKIYEKHNKELCKTYNDEMYKYPIIGGMGQDSIKGESDNDSINFEEIMENITTNITKKLVDSYYTLSQYISMLLCILYGTLPSDDRYGSCRVNSSLLYSFTSSKDKLIQIPYFNDIDPLNIFKLSSYNLSDQLKNTLKNIIKKRKDNHFNIRDINRSIMYISHNLRNLHNMLDRFINLLVNLVELFIKLEADAFTHNNLKGGSADNQFDISDKEFIAQYSEYNLIELRKSIDSFNITEMEITEKEEKEIEEIQNNIKYRYYNPDLKNYMVLIDELSIKIENIDTQSLDDNNKKIEIFNNIDNYILIFDNINLILNLSNFIDNPDNESEITDDSFLLELKAYIGTILDELTKCDKNISGNDNDIKKLILELQEYMSPSTYSRQTLTLEISTYYIYYKKLSIMLNELYKKVESKENYSCFLNFLLDCNIQMAKYLDLLLIKLIKDIFNSLKSDTVSLIKTWKEKANHLDYLESYNQFKQEKLQKFKDDNKLLEKFLANYKLLNMNNTIFLFYMKHILGIDVIKMNKDQLWYRSTRIIDNFPDNFVLLIIHYIIYHIKIRKNKLSKIVQ